MPIKIRPREDEEKTEFISRCMSNEQMVREFPDKDQRVSVCFSRWDKIGEVNKGK